MTCPLSRCLQLLTLIAAAAAPLASAWALVGAEPDSRFADRVAMVLIRGGDKAGFCSALVLSPRVLLTAAHCLRPLRDMAVHYRDAANGPVIIPVGGASAKCHVCRARAGLHGSHLGRRSDRKGGRRLQRRFRSTRLVGGRIGCDCDRRLGGGRAWARLRRLDARAAACADERLDRGDRAKAGRRLSRLQE